MFLCKKYNKKIKFVMSLKSVRLLDSVLDLERFGFTRVKEDNEDKIINFNLNISWDFFDNEKFMIF